MPGPSSTHCLFDSRVHTDTIASIAPKDAQKKAERAEAKARPKGKQENEGDEEREQRKALLCI